MASNQQNEPAPQTGNHGNTAVTAPAPKRVVKKVIKRVVDPNKPSTQSTDQGSASKSNTDAHVSNAASTNDPKAASSDVPKKVVKRVVKKAADPSRPTQTSESNQQGLSVPSNGYSDAAKPAPSNNAVTPKSAPTTKVVRRVVEKVPEFDGPATVKNTPLQAPTAATEAELIDPYPSTKKAAQTTATKSTEPTGSSTSMRNASQGLTATAQVKRSTPISGTEKAATTAAMKTTGPTNSSNSKKPASHGPAAVTQAKSSPYNTGTEKAAEITAMKTAGPSNSNASTKAAGSGQTPSASTKTAQPSQSTNIQAKEVTQGTRRTKIAGEVTPSTLEEQKPRTVSNDASSTAVNQAATLPTMATSSGSTSKSHPIAKETQAATKTQAEFVGTKNGPPPVQQSRAVPGSTRSNDATLNAELRKEVVAGVARGMDKMFDGLKDRLSK